MSMTFDRTSADWQIDARPGRATTDGDYDVVVIGSGMGGLGCAALLSKWGYRTLVLEHHNLVGGYYSSFSRSGFRFNVGAMEITGLWDGGPFDLFLRELGLKVEDYFSTNSYNYRLGEWRIEPFEDLGGLTEQFSSQFPGEVDGIASFFADAQAAHQEWFLDGRLYGCPPPPRLIGQVFGEDRLREDAARRRRYYDWHGKSWGEKLDEHFRGDGIKALLDFLLNHLQVDPHLTPAEVALRTFAFMRYGSYYPKGGAQALSDAVRDAIRDQGGEVLTCHTAEEIVTKEGRVIGVRTGDEVFRSDVVVSNSCVKNTILDLVDPRELPPGYLSDVEAIEMQEAYFLVFLGVDMDLRDYPTMTQVLDLENDDFFMVAINSNADSSYAPAGQASISIFSWADYDDFPPRGTPEYQLKKEAHATRVVELAGSVIPGLAGKIVAQDAATPRTLERYTLTPRGSGEGIRWSTEAPLPWFKSPVEGLYLAGSSTYPGAGLELALMSGIICANDIDGWQVNRRWGG
ncbi:phytoene desaturase family protein [Chloroflexota bacterium]